jgi:fimbrial isopeptide formation D2 family protein
VQLPFRRTLARSSRGCRRATPSHRRRLLATGAALSLAAMSFVNPAASSVADPATRSAPVTLGIKTLSKLAAPTINAPAATIGEPVRYTLTATVSPNVTMYVARLTDPLGSRLAFCDTTTVAACPADLSGTVQVGSAPPTNIVSSGFTLSSSGNTIRVGFPATYSTTASASTITVTFYAIVTDVTPNVAGGAPVTNTATLSWNDPIDTPFTPITASQSTAIVEPALSITKTDAPGGPYPPSATITYTVVLANSGTSAAHDVVVVDALPPSMVSTACLSAPAGWTCTVAATTHTITWKLATTSSLPAGSTATFTYAANVPSSVGGSQSFLNTVTATAASLDTLHYAGARTSYTATATDSPDVSASVTPDVPTPSPTPTTPGPTQPVSPAHPTSTQKVTPEHPSPTQPATASATPSQTVATPQSEGGLSGTGTPAARFLWTSIVLLLLGGGLLAFGHRGRRGL